MPTDLQNYAVMVICAADVDWIWHISTANGVNPQAQPIFPAPGPISPTNQVGYIHSGNFDLLAQIRCNDIFISESDNVYYGLVLKAKQAVGPIAPGDMLVAVRGTMDDLEWLNDAAAIAMVDAGPTVQGQVGEGFWQIYKSMTLGPVGGAALPGGVVANIVARANQENCPNIFVCGHSLGAALATYLSYDLNDALGADAGRLRPYFFASPKTGTGDWVNWYQRKVVRYDLTNYALDFVPMVPPDGDILNAGSGGHNVHIITARSPGALDIGLGSTWDASKNHSPIGYARMLDLQNQVAVQLLAAAGL